MANVDNLVGKLICVRQVGTGLRDLVLAFVNCREVLDLVGHLAVPYLSVRRLDKSVVVDSGIGSDTVDESDRRTFGCFDGTNASVVRGVNIAHLESRVFTRKTAGTQSRNPSLVRNFGQWIVVVHHLRKLMRTEELTNCRDYWLCVDHVLRHESFTLGQGKPISNRSINTG